MEHKLRNVLAENSISLNPSAIDKLCSYYDILVEWNKKFNLTTLITPQDYIYKHILDSLLPAKFFPFVNTNLVDVGTGAGFPGLPLKIAFPSISLTLVEAAAKKAAFLEHCCNRLNIEAEIVCQRGENFARGPKRGTFALAITRGVAVLSVVNEYCLPLLLLGGHHLAMRGATGGEDAVLATLSMEALGGEVDKVIPYQLPQGDQRTLIIVKKTQATPDRFPRRPGIPAKRPL